VLQNCVSTFLLNSGLVFFSVGRYVCLFCYFVAAAGNIIIITCMFESLRCDVILFALIYTGGPYTAKSRVSFFVFRLPTLPSHFGRFS
jgi:hypothetical protein